MDGLLCDEQIDDTARVVDAMHASLVAMDRNKRRLKDNGFTTVQEGRKRRYVRGDESYTSMKEAFAHSYVYRPRDIARLLLEF